MALSLETLGRLPPAVQRPSYDVAATGIGILHVGIGAFHRAHQAVYTDDAMAGDARPRWGICGVSLRTAGAAEALTAQDGLYTLLSAAPDGVRPRVIGSLREALVLSRDRARILARLADPAVALVTLTVTEKGYCHDPATGRLDAGHPEIGRDLATPGQAVTMPGLLVEGLRRRMAAGGAPLTILSCDNLHDNGRVLAAVIGDLAAQRDPALARWIEDRVRFPASMVDGIVPAARDEERALAAGLLGTADAVPVVAEPFRRWVIEEDFAADRPPWERCGVEFVGDVAPYEAMKLRLLNAPHSALAYLGALAGHDFIHQVVSDPPFRRYAAQLMEEEMRPTLPMAAAATVDAYHRAILPRFSNPALSHRTRQIAMDGSQKLPVRLLAAARERLAADAPVTRIALAVAGWMRFVLGRDEAGRPYEVNDPMAVTLAGTLADAPRAADAIARRLLSIERIFGTDLPADPRFTGPVIAWLGELLDEGTAAVMRRHYG